LGAADSRGTEFQGGKRGGKKGGQKKTKTIAVRNDNYRNWSVVIGNLPREGRANPRRDTMCPQLEIARVEGRVGERCTFEEVAERKTYYYVDAWLGENYIREGGGNVKKRGRKMGGLPSLEN